MGTRLFSSQSEKLLQLRVFFVGDRFEPLIAYILAGHSYSNMTEPAVRLGAVPVLHVGRNLDNSARDKAHCRLALFLIPALASGFRYDMPMKYFAYAVFSVPFPKTLTLSNSAESIIFIIFLLSDFLGKTEPASACQPCFCPL